MQCIATCTLEINQNKEMLSKRLSEKLSLRFFIQAQLNFTEVFFLNLPKNFLKNKFLPMCTLTQLQTQLYSA